MVFQKRMAEGKLDKASSEAVGAGVHHLVLSVNENKLEVRGSSNFVFPLLHDGQLCDQIKNLLMQNSVVADPANVLFSSNKVPQYDKLPYSPYSPQWKGQGSTAIRKILTEMLNTAGYKSAGRKKTLGKVIKDYFIKCAIFILDDIPGVGPAPIGWPEDIPWEEFSGTTRSKLTVEQITRIIISMLTTVGIDPAQHVITAEVPVKPVEEANNDNNEENEEYEVVEGDINANQRDVNRPAGL